MSLRIHTIDHVQITTAKEHEEACKYFYGTILGLPEIPKPPNLAMNAGAWYQLGTVGIHLSIETNMDNRGSKRHICYLVDDLAFAEQVLRDYGVEIIPDKQPIEAAVRFYVRDPGGNRIEMTQRLK